MKICKKKKKKKKMEVDMGVDSVDFGRCDVYSKFDEFWGMFRQQKCDN